MKSVVLLPLILLVLTSSTAHAGWFRKLLGCVGLFVDQKKQTTVLPQVEPPTERIVDPELFKVAYESYRNLPKEVARVVRKRLSRSLIKLLTLGDSSFPVVVVLRQLFENGSLEYLVAARESLRVAAFPLIFEEGSNIDGFPIDIENITDAQFLEQVEFHHLRQSYLEEQDIVDTGGKIRRRRGLRVPYFRVVINGQIFSVLDLESPTHPRIQSLRWEMYASFMIHALKVMILLDKLGGGLNEPYHVNMHTFYVGNAGAAEQNVDRLAAAYFAIVLGTEKLPSYFKKHHSARQLAAWDRGHHKWKLEVKKKSSDETEVLGTDD